MIVAVSPDGVIGRGYDIPWKHPGDQRRFKRVTLGGALIMGRTTYESVGRPLPGRRNLVVTSGPPIATAGVETYRDIASALAAVPDDVPVWFVGGARIYEEAMRYADFIDVTYVPDKVPVEGAVIFPRIDEALFEAGPILEHEDEPGLTRRVFTRR
jgi:dihydrofolate reductase